ncbi:MAG: hypothetical protein HKN26_17245 [Acidimicrobiales bacterium]|nr:hypothetical protein [Acidimicrobiales bacterium]
MNATTAVRREPAFEDPAAVWALTRSAPPYYPLGRDAASAATFVPPWFRQDFASFGEVHVSGAEVILHNPAYVDAAHEIFGADVIVEPTTEYVNVMAPAAYPFVAHTDVPVFLGASRKNMPAWFLNAMLASGLFEAERVRLATAVAWSYGGPGGAFHYWPEGPEASRQVVEPPFDNVAVVADNEVTFHGVGKVGERSTAIDFDPPLTLDAAMVFDGADGQWHIDEAGARRASFPDDIIRTTISWKAEIYRDEAERGRVAAAQADPSVGLSLDTIVARLRAGLAALGRTAPASDHPFADEAASNEWSAALGAAYPQPAPRIR